MRPYEKCIALVVNDDLTQLIIISTILRKDGLTVHACESALQALTIMRTQGPPDIIITDLQMPEIDGWRLCWLLRSPVCPAYNHIPILIVSATYILEDATDIKSLGADAFLPSPFTPGRLQELVRGLLEGRYPSANPPVLVAGADDTTMMICSSFAKKGHSVSHFATPETTLNNLPILPAAFLVIHHSISEDFGEKLLAKAREISPRLPVAMITNDTAEATSLHFLSSGAAGCLPEPLDFIDLYELYRKIIKTCSIMDIENRIETQARALKASEKRYQTLFERMIDGFALCDIVADPNGTPIDYRFQDINPAFEKITGMSRSELIGRNCKDVPADFTNDWIELFVPVTTKGLPVHFSSYSPSTAKHLEVHAFKPEPGQLAITISDVSERKHSERKNQERQERIKSIFRAAPIAIGTITNRTLTDINDKILSMLGYRPDELIGQNTRILYRDEDEYRRVGAELFRMLEKDSVGATETQWKKKDGTIIDVLLSSSRIKWAGASQDITFIAIDITERKRAEQALRESEIRFRQLVESAPDAIYVQTNGRFAYLNSAALRLFGAEKRLELLGEQIIDRFLPRYHNEVRERIYRINFLKQPMTRIEQTYLRLDGTPVPAEASAVPINYRGEDGALVYARDITERKRSEDVIVQSRWLLSSIREAQNLYIVGSDADNVFTTLLDTLVEITGSEYGFLHEVVGKGESAYMKSLAVSELPTPIEFRNFLDSREDNTEFRNLDNLLGQPVTTGKLVIANDTEKDPRSGGTPPGHPKILCFMGIPMYFGGELLGVAGIANREGGYSEDLADFLEPFISTCASVIHAYRRDRENSALLSQLHQAQKMEAIGQLAGGIAHDFNNVLTAILGCSQLLHQKLPNDSTLQQYVEMLLSSGEKAAGLTQSLLAFSKKQSIEPRPIDVNKIVAKISKLLGRLIGEDIDFCMDLGNEQLTINADSTQVEQVLMNLATNARDAMPNGGTITIKTYSVILDDKFINIYGWGEPGEYVVISFSDTGTGIPSSIREKIFEPFFTTKDTGKGTGLGLSIVHGIIRQHEGYISLESTPGHGSTFSIYLPKLDCSCLFVDKKEPSILAMGTETIMVAEDDPNARTLVSLILREQGYTVIEAVDGLDALEKYSANLWDIDLVLLDVVMPRKNGDAVFREILEMCPGQRIIFMSGYTADRLNSMDLSENSSNFIAKPLTPLALLRKVRDTLSVPAKNSRTPHHVSM